MTLSTVDLNDIFMHIKLALTLFTYLTVFKLKLNKVIKDFVECEIRSRYDSSFSPSSSRRFVWKLMETVHLPYI